MRFKNEIQLLKTAEVMYRSTCLESPKSLNFAKGGVVDLKEWDDRELITILFIKILERFEKKEETQSKNQIKITMKNLFVSYQPNIQSQAH